MSHSNESVFNTKEPVRYTNKLFKKTTDTKLQRILAVNKKNLILANITMNDKRGQERNLNTIEINHFQFSVPPAVCPI